jgi:Smg protein
VGNVSTGFPRGLQGFLIFNGNRNCIPMFDILVYLFENYYTPQSCPQTQELADTLADAGFEHDDINDALGWLSGLAETTERCGALATSPLGKGTRIYADHEYQMLGSDAIGFIAFLENSGALSPVQREIVIEQALICPESPVSLPAIKIIALMVLWSQEAEVDHLVFEELLIDEDTRQSH